MGFIDRLLGKFPSESPSTEETAPENEAEPPESAHDTHPVVPRLAAALEQLELRNIEEAQAIYEEILNSPAGSRPDVLVRISGDLGATGHVDMIPQLIAPRYDAERHGPATGINLLQAYLALREPEAAQHVLDLLFALKKPELEERLWGFSNAIGELIEARRHGLGASPEATTINLVSISKPIWSYGVETLPDLLPAKDQATKTVAFAQLALPEMENAAELAKAPEESLGRLSRGLPLWLAETLFFSPQYHALTAVGMVGQEHYALFQEAWNIDNIRQLIETSSAKVDYVVTGELAEHDGDFQLRLHLWEIKGFRERKTFETTWTPVSADQELAGLHQQVEFFFECQSGPGLPYQRPVSATAWIDTMAVSLATFLADKKVLPRAQLAPLPEPLAAPDTTPAAAIAHLTLVDRCARLGVEAAPAAMPDHPLVARAQAHLGAPPS